MATVKRPTTMQRPVPGPAAAASTRRDYTQPPPGGTHYPWEPGGGSKVPGVPDNWSDFYPNEGEGRGDAWIGPKKAQLNAEHPPSSYQGMPSARSSMSPQDFAKYQQGALPQNQAAKDALAGMHDPSHDAPVAQGKPGVYDWQRGGWPVGTDQTALALKMHGAKPGPLTNIGGAPGSGGTYQGGNTITPPTKPGAKPAAAPTQDQLNQQFAGMKPGAKITAGGKTYFKNQNGAVVDVTNPAARKRITDRQGKLIGQAAAPPTTTPPGTPAATTPPGRVPIGNQPPPTTPGGQVRRPVDTPPQQQQPPPYQYPPTNQQPYQYDPSSLNQFGYPQNQGPGPYGWNPGYGGPPFNYSNSNPYSNFSNALMQGMGGGYGMPAYDGGNYAGSYGWPEQSMGGYANGMMDYGGMPQQFSQGMMGGFAGENNLMGGLMQSGYGGGPIDTSGMWGDPMAMGYGMPQGMMGYY
jgi:hypothetical protein